MEITKENKEVIKKNYNNKLAKHLDVYKILKRV